LCFLSFRLRDCYSYTPFPRLTELVHLVSFLSPAPHGRSFFFLTFRWGGVRFGVPRLHDSLAEVLVHLTSEHGMFERGPVLGHLPRPPSWWDTGNARPVSLLWHFLGRAEPGFPGYFLARSFPALDIDLINSPPSFFLPPGRLLVVSLCPTEAAVLVSFYFSNPPLFSLCMQASLPWNLPAWICRRGCFLFTLVRITSVRC